MPTIVPLVVIALLAAAAKGAHAAPSVRSVSTARGMSWSTFEPLVAAWAWRAKIPPVLLWSIAPIESGRDPNRVNLKSPGDAKRGGAWGLFGVTLATALGLWKRYPKLRTFAASKRFDGTGTSLLDPGVNTMFAAAYLAELWREFGRFVPTVAAYNAGAAPVRAAIRRGGEISDYPTKSQQYIAEALQAQSNALRERALATSVIAKDAA